jgi:hypothetical protein
LGDDTDIVSLVTERLGFQREVLGRDHGDEFARCTLIA